MRKYDETKGYLTKYSTDVEDYKATIYFKRKLMRDQFGKPIIAGTEIDLKKAQGGQFFIGYKGATRFEYLDVSAQEESVDGVIGFTINKLRYRLKDSDVEQTIEINPNIIPKYITIISERPRPGIPYVYKIKDSDKSIQEYFTDLFKKLVPIVKKLVTGQNISGMNYNSKKTVFPSEVGVPDELKLARTIQNITITKPLGHCIARALQLLRNVPLKGEPSLSFICKAKFLESSTITATGTKTVVSRSGIPEPGSSIDTSPGIAALSQLFYDTIQYGSPKLEIGMKPGPNGQSSLQQYIIFMKNMARLFGDDIDLTLPQTEEFIKKLGPRGIKNRRDKELCGQMDSSIKLPYDVANKVYSIVNLLFKIQLQHASKCGALFKELFNIQSSGTGRYNISLNDNIIKKGLPEIERLNSIARTLLIDYYSNCETKYLQGMKIVLDNMKR
jgi:hypothetical protein